ncbi:MAG: hypothetical protein JWN43_1023, partial [Gammaproteobacteria bacterium]|nr:hypothetical protein [Gammaproteobacteria bacterium]
MVEEPLFRIEPVRRFALGGSSELMYFLLSGRVRVFPRSVANALAGCVGFKPLAAHAQALKAYMSEPAALLEELRSGGGVIS